MNEAIRVPGMTEEECRQLIPPGTFLLGYAGSRAHGTYPPPEVPGSVDDIDLMGVAFAKPEVYLGLAQWDHVQIIRGQWEKRKNRSARGTPGDVSARSVNQPAQQPQAEEQPDQSADDRAAEE